MPPAARSGTATTPAKEAEDQPSVTMESNTVVDDAGRAASSAVSSAASSVGHLAAMPAAVTRAVADDIATTARRPDAVLYWGGLLGMAALGVLEWPVAVAVGVGVAVAAGRRQARPESKGPRKAVG